MSHETFQAAVTVGLLVAFASLVTVHVATLFGLLRAKRYRWALLGLAVPPLAPYGAFTLGMRARAALWIALAALYVGALVLAR